MLHITNGESTKAGLERSGVPGRFSSWDDILHEGPTPLVSGEEWLRVRGRYLASAGYGLEEEISRDFRVKDDALETLGDHGTEDEVVFWFEHDLYDQLLVIRHLWWIGAKGAKGAEGANGAGAKGAEGANGAGAKGAEGANGAGAEGAKGAGRARQFSMVMGNEYLGLLKPEDFPSRFERRQPITTAQIELGSMAWTAYCGDDPTRLLPIAEGGVAYAEHLPYLPRAMRRLLEEFPSAENGLARSERQILEVLSEGTRTPEQAFIGASRLEEDIWMGDWSFWTIAKRLNAGTHPLLTLDVQPRPGRLPTGTLEITATGRRVLARRADHIDLNAPSRWIGGTLLTPERPWRWTGSAFLRPSA